MALPAPSPAHETSSLELILSALLLFGAIVLTHSFYVSLFASNYPFWDQWDQLHAELIPWWQGHGSLSLLFTPHNEHRILFTRIMSMTLLWMNQGQWSNLVEAYFNTLVWSGVLTLFYLLVAREIKTLPIRIVLMIFVIGMCCLPFDWENTLVGFQSQFYFMLGVTVLLAGCAAYATDSRTRSAFMLTLGVASVFTMAAGLLAPLAGIAVLGMRGLPARAWSPRTLLTASGLFATAVMGLILLPHVPGDIPLQAHGLVEHIRAMLLVLTWPLEGFRGLSLVFALLLWLPFNLALARVLLGNKSASSELFLLGIASWVLLQAFAIAHARGHGMTTVPSRYTDIVVLGVLANFAMIMVWASTPSESRGLRNISAAWLLLMIPLVCWTMINRTPGDVSAMAGRGMYSQIETINVSRFMATGDERYLERPGLEIPYPSASILKRYLLEPGIRSMIVRSQGANSADASGAGLTRLAEALRDSQRTIASRLGIPRPFAQFQPLDGELLTRGNGEPGAACTTDSLNGSRSTANADMHPGELLSIQGWIVWPPDVSSSESGMLILSGRASYQIDLNLAANRPDVVKALHSPLQSTRGFSVTAPLGQVVPDIYDVAIAKAVRPNAMIYCRLPITLSITP
jgi:hypothetical protein